MSENFNLKIPQHAFDIIGVKKDSLDFDRFWKNAIPFQSSKSDIIKKGKQLMLPSFGCAIWKIN